MPEERTRPPIRSYKDLEVYQRAREMRSTMHRIALALPDFEKFDLSDQIRRASKSVPTNIAERFAHRDTPAKLKQFLRIAMGSANELETHLEAALDLGYIQESDHKSWVAEYQIIGKQLNRLITTWQRFERPASSFQPPASAPSKKAP